MNTNEEYDEYEDEFYEEDGKNKKSENYLFPPYKIRLVSVFGDLKSEVFINDKKVAVLHALAGEIAADVQEDRLFLHTAGSSHSDARTVFCYKLSTGEKIWQVGNSTTCGLVLNSSQKHLDAGKPYGYKVAYLMRIDYDGNVINRNFRDCYEIVEFAEEAYKNSKFGEAEKLFNKALITEISPNTKAKVYKYLGQIAEGEGNLISAVRHYEKALSINPKVGVKKYLAAIKKIS